MLPSLVGSTYIGDFGLTIAVISASLRRALPTECHPPLRWDAFPTPAARGSASIDVGAARHRLQDVEVEADGNDTARRSELSSTRVQATTTKTAAPITR